MKNGAQYKFCGPINRPDFFLKTRGSQVAMAAAIAPIDYTNVPTEDLIVMAQAHVLALNFKGLKVDSRGSALAALLGICLHTDLQVH